MHFLSAGRDDRIQRWIADQLPPVVSDGDRQQDSLESAHRKEHDARIDMEWELEELERQMSLTAAAFGRDWRTSLHSLDGSSIKTIDLASLRRLSQLTVKQLDPELESAELQVREEPKESEPEPEVEEAEPPRGEFEKRREGRIISQPPIFPPEPVDPVLLWPAEPERPRPNLTRTRTAPPPITTTGRFSASSARPPITFILQESASPLPSAMHFTPTPLDLDAFPSTPRSFTSFAIPGQSEPRHSEEETRPNGDQQRDLGQFLAPHSEEGLLSPSPTTPKSSRTSLTDASTPSLSAFPATPGSPYSMYPHGFPFPHSKAEDVPPVPKLPENVNRNKELPPSPSSTFRPFPSASPYSSSRDPSPDQDDDGRSESGSEISVGPLSSRFSVFSSRFSDSSHGSEPRAGSRIGVDSRAGSRAGSRPRAGSRAGTTRSRAGSAARADSRAGTIRGDGSPAPPPPTASVRNLMMTLKRSRSQGALPKPRLRIHTMSPSLSIPRGAPKSAVDRWTKEGGEMHMPMPVLPETPIMMPSKACAPPVSSSPNAQPTPKTPVTPSSAVSAFFGMARSASLARKHRLVVKGVKRDERCEAGLRQWCENIGSVKRITRSSSSEDVYVQFRDRDVYKKAGGIEQRQINMPDVGSVSLSWVRGSARGIR